jgi:hypothetical protein
MSLYIKNPLAAQPAHCRRRDEPELRLGHLQWLAAAESETVIELRNMKTETKMLTPELRRRDRGFLGSRPGSGPCYSHGRVIHYSQDGLPRFRPWLKKGELNHEDKNYFPEEDKNSFPGTAPKDGCLLARR